MNRLRRRCLGHHQRTRSGTAPKSPRMDAKGLAESILAGLAMDEEGRKSADDKQDSG